MMVTLMMVTFMMVIFMMVIFMNYTWWFLSYSIDLDEVNHHSNQFKMAILMKFTWLTRLLSYRIDLYWISYYSNQFLIECFHSNQFITKFFMMFNIYSLGLRSNFYLYFVILKILFYILIKKIIQKYFFK